MYSQNEGSNLNSMAEILQKKRVERGREKGAKVIKFRNLLT